MQLAMICRRNPSPHRPLITEYRSLPTAHRSPLTVFPRYPAKVRQSHEAGVFRLQVGSWQNAVGNGLLSEPVLNAKAQRRKIASC